MVGKAKVETGYRSIGYVLVETTVPFYVEEAMDLDCPELVCSKARSSISIYADEQCRKLIATALPRIRSAACLTTN